MIVWFIAIFTIGIWRITFYPSILLAFNPWEALSYLIREKREGFVQMGTEIEGKSLLLDVDLCLPRWSVPIRHGSGSPLCRSG